MFGALENWGILPSSYNPQNKGSIGMAADNVQAPTPCTGDDNNRWNLAGAFDSLMEHLARI
jgi:hypothetical protein